MFYQSFFPIKMLATLERTQSNSQRNMEQTQNPTIIMTAHVIDISLFYPAF